MKRKSGRRLKILLIWGIVALAAVVAGMKFVKHRYQNRPFFAGSFAILGHGRVLGWDYLRGTYFGDYRAYYDIHDRVILVVPIESHSVLWLVDWQPVSEQLRLRRQPDDAIRFMEWRRNCIVYVDHDGVPTYAPLTEDEFMEAVYDTNDQIIEELLDRVMSEDPSERESAQDRNMEAVSGDDTK